MSWLSQEVFLEVFLSLFPGFASKLEGGMSNKKLIKV